MKKIVINFLALFFVCTSFFSQESRTILDTLGRDSIVQTFHQNGQLFYQVSYKNGTQNGWYEQYHDNGFIFSKDFRVDGLTMDGEYIYLNSKGAVYQKGMFYNGVQVGKWYTFDSNEIPYKVYKYSKCGKLQNVKKWNSDTKKWDKSKL